MSTRILVIENEDPHLRLMEWLLGQEGFEVSSLRGPDRTASELRPDVIVMNTGMPAAGKRVWIESLRYLVPEVKVIDLMPPDAQEGYDTGADGYLEAPYRVDELSVLMKEALGRELGNKPQPWRPLS